ncbi:hypothetical protein ACFODZ_12035 [Marinicella sediminis]|uniref:Uncharacterized protein n=1 Tax=Marinicella sediminis TaxID=1792834 RepID=A0ABV7JA12_9GAMM|nr:hypothetical protein [Marinicella sediminis]
MMMLNAQYRRGLMIGLLLLAGVAQAQQVGSRFTYQGTLTDGGSPASGDYGMRFELRDQATGGNMIAFQELAQVTTDAGLFTVELDFGPGPFTGAEFYLRVMIRPFGSVDPYTELTPWQRINATPYALQAEYLDDKGASAGQVLKFDGSDWVPGTDEASTVWVQQANGITYPGGNVQIGGSANSNPPADNTLFIEAAAGDSPIRARIGGQTRFQVQSNGGTNLGGGPLAPANGLYVQGDTDINAGLTVEGNTLLDVTNMAVSSGAHPLTATVNGQFALQIRSNLGVSVGPANAAVIPPPTQGLYVFGETVLNNKTTINDDLAVDGDAVHDKPATQYGFVKAGVTFSCGNAGSMVQQSFNNINAQSIMVSNGATFGNCVVDLPFSYQGLFFMTSVEENGSDVMTVNCNKGTQGGVNEVVVCQVYNVTDDTNIVVAQSVTLLMF